MEIFDVSIDLVIDRMPLDGRSITATSATVNFVSIHRSIERASSMFLDALSSNGMSVESIQASTRIQIQEGVINFAVAEALDSLGFAEKADNFRRQFQERYQSLLSRPQMAGKSYSVPTVDVEPEDGLWSFKGFGFKF